MNFNQLQDAFDAYTGNSVQADAAQLALWFNEALFDLAYSFGPVICLELQLAADEAVTMPEDCLQVIAAEDEYTRAPDGRLVFPDGAAGKLWYRAVPPLFSGTDSGQECPLHPALHYLLALFAVSRSWDVESEGDSEESSQAAKWLAYYYQGKNLARSMEAMRQEISGWRVQ